jgi:WD40 repeat protein
MDNKNAKNDENNNPINLKYSFQITDNSYGCFDLDNTFTVFKKIYNKLYLVYSTKYKSIVCYNLDEFQKISEIKNHHKKYITNLRHFQDKTKKLDLIISISDRDNNLRLWNIYNWECILNIININTSGYICSAYIINDNNQNYILSTNFNMMNQLDISEPIKIFNFRGEKIKEIKESDKKTFFIDTFYDKDNQTNYIITGNLYYIKTYDYNKNEVYHKYFDSDTGCHISIIVYDDEGIKKLIESCSDGNIRIWNFHSAALLKRIKVFDDWLFGICLWNKDYLFVGCKNTMIRLVDIKEGYIIKYLEGPKSGIFTIKKIIHPKFGECLLSQGYEGDQIKLYSFQP